MPFARALLLLLAVGGCQHFSRSAPPPARPIDVKFGAYAGTALGVATTQPTNLSDGWCVRVTLLALPKSPGLVLQPLSASGRLFAQPGGGEAVIAGPQLTAQSRFGADEAARSFFNTLQDPASGKYVGIVSENAVLAHGITLSVAVTDGERSLQLRLQRKGANAVNVLLSQARPAVAASEEVSSEMALLDDVPITYGQPVVILAPAPMKESGVEAIAVRFDFALPSADEAMQAAIDQTRGWLDKSRATVSAMPTSLPVKNDVWSGYELVLRNDETGQKRRAAMNFVAAQTGATLAHDLILVVDDATIEALHKSVLDSMPTLNRQGVLLGWLMDYAAIKLCAERAAAGPLVPEMMSVLTIHIGEPGRNPASLGDLINGLSSREELQTRVMIENTIYLEDSSPAARVRAFDFLSARGRAPAGYDPLGPLRERRDALERASTTTP